MSVVERPRPRKRRALGPGRLSAADAALLGDRILDAATALFIENGFGATTMEGIAKEAGASTKTLYSRYANKMEILSATARRGLARSIAALSDKSIVEGKEEDPTAYLHRVGLEYARLYEQREAIGMVRLTLSEGHRVPELAQLYVDNVELIIDVLSERLEHWHRAGKLPHMPHSRVMAALFIDMVASIVRTRAVIGKPIPKKQVDWLVEFAADMFLRGCGVPSTRKIKQPPAA